MAAKRKGDREKLVPLILDRIASGETLVSVAQALGISARTVYKWIAEAEANDGREYLAYAREAGADTLAAQALAIADDTSQDTIETEHGPVLNREFVSRSKLRVETRLKLAAVFCPAKYGQKAQLEHSGPGGKPIESVSRVVLVDLVAEGAGPSG